MRAAVIEGYGGSERLRVREVARPAVGPGQVLIRVRAAGVNPIDWKIRRGHLRLVRPARFPLVLGYDAAGEVVEIGPEVSRFFPGDAVFAFLDGRHGGAYSEYAVAGEGAVAEKPPALSFEEAAALPLAGLTALRALRDLGELAAGERALVHGAAGGVGHLAVQIGVALGAAVVGVASGAHQDFVRSLGAVRTIDREREDFTLDEETYEVVFDAAGTSSYRRCEPLLDPRGGVYVSTATRSVLWSALTAATSLLGDRPRSRTVFVRPDGQGLAYLAWLAESGKLRPAIERVFDLDDVAAAHDLSESGRVRGKLVLRIAGEDDGRQAAE